MDHLAQSITDYAPFIMMALTALFIIGVIAVYSNWKDYRLAKARLLENEKCLLVEYIYVIRLIQPTTFFDTGTPLLTPIEVPAGVYELVCIPSLDRVEQFWWSIFNQEVGIQPLALKELIENGQAKWLKKPKQIKP